MEERKWEELNKDCLVEIFARVGIQSLSQCIQFVCKSWYNATLVPKCWETLVFLAAYDDEFVKSVVDRSQGTATHIKFHKPCPNRVLGYISENCPALKSLYLCDSVFDDCALTSNLVCKWKKLEFLHFSDEINLKQILESISHHCKNFVGLSYLPHEMYEAESAAIVEFIPKIKSLNIRGTYMLRECLVKILKGCRELEFLDVGDCIGFDAHDTEILKLASHIPSFNCRGSTTYEFDWSTMRRLMIITYLPKVLYLRCSVIILLCTLILVLCKPFVCYLFIYD